MNFGFMFIFLLIQIGVNALLRFALPALGVNLGTIYGVIAYYMLSSLLISFFAALLATPREYRKDFIRQPMFHRTMIIYFAVFMVIDLIFIGVGFL